MPDGTIPNDGQVATYVKACFQKVGFNWFSTSNPSLVTILKTRVAKDGAPYVFCSNGIAEYSNIGLTLGISFIPYGISSVARTVLFGFATGGIVLCQVDFSNNSVNTIKAFS